MNDQTITEDMLTELGIEVTEQEKTTLLTHANDTLQERIGEEITEYLDDEQLKEFLALQESTSDEEVGTWLAERVPNLQDIVSDNLEIVLGELADSTDDINTAE